jgi:nicotinate-nucleotide adenylyltransferase
MLMVREHRWYSVPDQQRIGVFGGTFDPIHIGHLVIAEILQFELDLDTVLFLPAGRPPHKPEQVLAGDEHRLEMLRIAIEGCDRFEISTVDLDRSGNSYTARTLEILSGAYGESSDLYFLMGQDSLRDFPTWKDPDKIARLAKLGVALRPNVDVSIDSIEDAVPAARGRILVVDVPLIDVSSRAIRNNVRSGRPFRFQVPRGVANYIDTRRLYR